MTRLRVWLLTVLAALFIAGPTVAYWPVLFAVPAVFGQEETPRTVESKRTIRYVESAEMRSTADAGCDELCCELLGECLTTWQKLWQQGRFREAYELAKCAVRAAPDNVEARHAFVVSQMVIQATDGTPLRTLPVGHYGDCANQSTGLPVGHYGNWMVGATVNPLVSPRCEIRSGLTPAGTLTPDLKPIKTVSFDIECEFNCPLTKFLATLFGGSKECVGAKCGQCPVVGSCCQNACAAASKDPIERAIQRKLETPNSFYWKDARLCEVIDDLRTLTGINLTVDERALRAAGICLDTPMSLSVENIKLKSALNILLGQCKLGFVIKEKALQITTAEKVAQCSQLAEGQPGGSAVRFVRGQQAPIVIIYQREPRPNAPIIPVEIPAAFIEQMLEVPLPPPYFAPPPPPLAQDMQPYIPLPFPVMPPPPGSPVFFQNGRPVFGTLPVPPPAPVQRLQPTLYDPAEQCDAPMQVLTPMPAHVQITQHGRRVQMASPNYHAQCDRIRGGAHGQLILEGNVQLMSRRHGQTMSITAQRVLLNVKDDQFVVEQAEGMDASRVNIAPVSCEQDARRLAHWMMGNGNEWQRSERRMQAETLHDLPNLQVTPIRVHGGVGP